MVFYEAPHRIVDALADLCAAFGNDREAVVARELTKRFESVATGRLDDLLDRARTGAIPARGEIVVVVRGCVTGTSDEDATDSILQAMLDEGVTVRQSAAAAARLTGRPRNVLYRRAWSWRRPGTTSSRSRPRPRAVGVDAHSPGAGARDRRFPVRRLRDRFRPESTKKQELKSWRVPR